MKKVAGTLTLLVDGKPLTVGEGTFTVNATGVKREAIPGTNDYKETLTNTFIKGEVVTSQGLVTEDITNATDTTVQLDAANGAIYVLSEAAFTGEPDIAVSDGKLTIEFSAGPDNMEVIYP